MPVQLKLLGQEKLIRIPLKVLLRREANKGNSLKRYHSTLKNSTRSIRLRLSAKKSKKELNLTKQERCLKSRNDNVGGLYLITH
jgi:hypothetical protein